MDNNGQEMKCYPMSGDHANHDIVGKFDRHLWAVPPSEGYEQARTTATHLILEVAAEPRARRGQDLQNGPGMEGQPTSEEVRITGVMATDDVGGS